MSNDEIIKYSQLTPAICLVSNLLCVSFFFYLGRSFFCRIRRRACRVSAKEHVTLWRRWLSYVFKIAPEIISPILVVCGVRVHVK